MKTNFNSHRAPTRGYALLLVVVLVACMMIIMGGTLTRTYTVSKLNDRNVQFGVCQNAAEAATEKVYARMAYYFVNFGVGGVTNNLDLLRNSIPDEDTYWNNFQFSDAQGHVNKTYVSYLTNYTGPMPSQYPGLFTLNSPVYRIVSNAKLNTSRYSMTNAAQDDILLAMLPLTTYAIFYNGLLEFSTCATMTVNGRVHSNGSIYTGTSATLTFNATVTASGTLSSPGQ